MATLLAVVGTQASAGTWIVRGEGDSVYVGPAGDGLSGSSVRSSAERLGGATPATISSAGSAAINVPLSTAAGDQTYMAAAPDGTGGMIIVWQDDRNAATSGFDVYAQHLLGCGVVDPDWPVDGVALTQALGNDAFPVITGDGAGGAFVAWWANTGTPNSDVYGQHLLASGVVDPTWPANGLAICTAPGINRLPRIASDGAGGAYVTWDDARAGRRAFLQHLLSTGVDPNPAWTVDGIPVCPFPATQAVPNVCGDGSGGVIVAWNDLRSGAYDVYAQHFTSAAVPLWTADGVQATGAAGRQQLDGAPGGIWVTTSSEAQGNGIVSDGAGGCLLVWTDNRSGGEDIYGQRLTSLGAVAAGWPSDGLPLCTAAGSQSGANLVPDGAGGAFANWLDDRPDVYVQHFSGSGVIDGPTDGLGVVGPGVAPPWSYNPVGIGDGAGGMIVVWSDQRDVGTTGLDIYAQHVTGNPLVADPAWPAGGAAVSTAPADQYAYYALVADGGGGAVAGWEDSRNLAASGLDVYGQPVLGSGALAAFEVAGRVLADCPAPGTGLQGIVVDAFQVGSGEMSGTAVTDATGAYALTDLDPGNYTITVMTPLGFSAVAAEIPVTGCPGAVDFALHCLSPIGAPRSIGFWKHQVGVATGGKGSAQVDGASLCAFLDLIEAHFNSNAINQVIVYQPPVSGTCDDKLQVARELLNLTGSAAIIDRARQQLLALLLNVAAGYLNQMQVVSPDGATVSQAITYCDQVIDDPGGDYDQARSIAGLINNGQSVPAGLIPQSTPMIVYARVRAHLDFRATPNPSRGSIRFLFSTSSAGPVNLTVFDVAGRTVARLVDGPVAAGGHVISWNGPRSARGAAGTGIFFARLRTPEGSSTIRVLELME